jgi:hypothetical protein
MSHAAGTTASAASVLTVADPVDVLECAECGRQSEAGATGWRAYLGTEEELGPEDHQARCTSAPRRSYGTRARGATTSSSQATIGSSKTAIPY